MIISSVIAGQKSWTIVNNTISLSLTEMGGMMAPVTFFKDTDKPVNPFYINPWAEEKIDMTGQPGLLTPIRGDFFCLPFGGNNSWKNEHHPPHGEVSEEKWQLTSGGDTSRIELQLKTKSRKGKIIKQIDLRPGENNIYICHKIQGFTGPTSLGHHPIFPGGTKKYISTSPIKFGITDYRLPGPFRNGEYFSLAPAEEFKNLEKVPTIWKDEPYTDCSVFPARDGFIDHLQLFNEEAPGFAWSAVSAPEDGYLWFGLKDPKVLPSTLVWIENRGRHQTPWNGRNSCVGVEDVCSFLAHGLAASVEENDINRQGIKTFQKLTGKEDFQVRYIQGLVKIPGNFGKVSEIIPKGNGIEIKSENGEKVTTKVDPGFLNLQ
ncbi:MAG: hypothetical protein JEY99_04945 [Spirochaetales bacterium]|nr:hypothetical protein [Spirochaetales bacterium]